MVILPNRRRRKPTKRERAIGIGAGIAAATAAIVSNIASGGQRRPGSLGSTTTLLIFGGILVLPVIAFVGVKLINRGSDDEPHEDGMSDSSNSDEMNEEDSNSERRVVLIAIAAALAAIGMGVFAFASTAHAQSATDRGTLYVRRGADTLVTDRFAWTGDTLAGRVEIKGGARIVYTALTGPGYSVRTVAFDVYMPAQKETDKPATHLLFTMHDDTAIVETAAGPQRIITKRGAIPMVGNTIAMTELFTRRARAVGGTLDIPYLVVAGASPTITASLRPAGADSLVMTIAGQEQRFHVDAAGRILGGTAPAAGLEILRGASDAAAAPPVALGTTVAPPPDYSPPAGAPYTAEEVKVRGPGGIVLGGTLTKPKNSAGRLPVVVTITGSGQQDRDEFIPVAGGVRLFRQLADTLGRRGIAVLRLDDRGLGASGGDASIATTADFADDIRSAVAYLRTRPDIDPARIALAGHSEGGIIAPMIAATDPTIHAIVLFAGTAVPGIEISMAQNRYAVDRQKGLSPAQRDSILANARIQLDPAKQTVPWFKYFFAYDPAPALKKVKAATLVIQGETDRQVPAAQADLIATLIRSNGNKDVTVRLFPATNHLFVPDSSGDTAGYESLKVNKVRPEILGAVADWLVLKLGVSPVVK
jgi:dipeptidyl aminopeptidase/acylaminoacyl peptidase